MKPILFAATAFALLLASCSKDDDNNNAGGGSGGGNNNPGPLFNAVKTMMAGNCAVSGCHAGSTPTGGHDFANNGTIVAQKDRIKVRAVDQAGTANQMPPPPRAALTAAEQKTITDWIAAGGRLTD